MTETVLAKDGKAAVDGAKHLTAMLDELNGLLAAKPDKQALFKQVDAFNQENRRWAGVLRASPEFGYEYAEKMEHDLGAYPGFIEHGVTLGEQHYTSCQALVVGARYIVRSALHEHSVVLEPVDVGRIAQVAIDSARAMRTLTAGFERASITFDCRFAPGPLNAVSQADMLFRIIANLVGNSERAVEQYVDIHGREGEVKVMVGNDNEKIKVVVADTGVGFEKVFEKAKVSDDAREIPLKPLLSITQEGYLFRKGSGSGLRICQDLADKLHAEIYVTNPKYLKSGSEITVLLPAFES